MEYLIGLVLALAVAATATLIGFDRERSFYATILIVIACYYVLFAVMGASDRSLMIETAIASGFLLIAVVGFKINLWFIVAAIIAHGVFDLTHHLFLDNPGVPRWWPGFCLAFDLIVGGWLAMRLLTRSIIAANRAGVTHSSGGF
jgi:predicted secreted protein